MNSRTKAIINISALRQNVEKLKNAAFGSNIIAVVKDDAYGHGAGVVATSVESMVEGFAVATIDEGVQLRRRISRAPIWVLTGFIDRNELQCTVEQNLTPVIHNEDQVERLEEMRIGLPIVVKIDTGMGRLGFSPSCVSRILDRIPKRCMLVAVMSHFSSAESVEREESERQLTTFQRVVSDRTERKSLANTAGVLAYPVSHMDLIRPGLGIYGVSPFAGSLGRKHGLTPAMTLESYLISVRKMSKGDRIGYGGTWTCPQDMPVGYVGCGYGDGYPRAVANGASVLVDGQETPIIGRISMDSMAVDLRHLPQAQVGASVQLWGPRLPIEILADKSGTIPNEILTSVSQRVEREYIYEPE